MPQKQLEMLNLLRILFLLSLSTQQSVECNAIWNQNEKSSSSSSSSNEAQKSISESFPCDTFICMLDHFELLKTPQGFLLKALNSKPEPSGQAKTNCDNFQCWFKAFQISKTSYGFELTRKKQASAQESQQQQPTMATTTMSPFDLFRHQSTRQPQNFDIFQTYKDTEDLVAEPSLQYPDYGFEFQPNPDDAEQMPAEDPEDIYDLFY